MYQKLLAYLRCVKNLEVDLFICNRLLEEAHKESLTLRKELETAVPEEIPKPVLPPLRTCYMGNPTYNKFTPLPYPPAPQKKVIGRYDLTNEEIEQTSSAQYTPNAKNIIIILLLLITGLWIFAVLKYLLDAGTSSASKEQRIQKLLEEKNKEEEQRYEAALAEYEASCREIDAQNIQLEAEYNQKIQVLLAEAQENRKKREQETEKINEEIKTRQAQILREYENKVQNARIACDAHKADLMLCIANTDEKHTNLTTLKSRLEKALDELYSADIIFKSYRSIVPVTMFVQYLESERCYTLVGHEGAYNLYESELRANIIISNLEKISTNLDEIRDKQVLLHDALKDASAKIDVLSQAVKDQTLFINDKFESIESAMFIQHLETEEARNIETMERKAFQEEYLSTEKKRSQQAEHANELLMYHNSVLEDIRTMQTIDLFLKTS